MNIKDQGVMTKPNFETISIVGLGYIGLPTAAMFAARKIRVIGVDIDQSTVDTINRGGIHIVEPELDMVVRAAVHEGYLRATTSPEPAEAFLIAVPTPFKGEEHEPDLSYIEDACNHVAPVLKKGDLVILESTSPVGATEQMAEWLARARPDLSFPQTAGEKSDIRVAHCPERVLPGKVMQELISNDRIIGGMTQRCSELATRLYEIFVAGECVIASSPRVAEMAKLTENSFRDVNIAFANELSMISDELDIDVWELIALTNRHPRVNVLQPGPGVGGHCIAVDPWFIVASAPKQTRLIRAARNINDDKVEWVIEKIKLRIEEFLIQNPTKTVADVRVACFGISYKPDIDDTRESPALKILEWLDQNHPGPVFGVDPFVKTSPKSLRRTKLVDAVFASQSADICVKLVNHTVFSRLDKVADKYLDFASPLK